MPNVVDAILGGVILLSGVFGLRRGFARESLSLAIWGVIFLAALFISDFVAVAKQLAGEQLSQMPSLLIFFAFLLLLLLAGAIVGLVLQRLIKAIGLGDVDRAAGALFGIFRGVLVTALVTIYLPPLFMLEQTEVWRESRLAELLTGMDDTLSQLGVRLHDSLRGLSAEAALPGPS